MHKRGRSHAVRVRDEVMGPSGMSWSLIQLGLLCEDTASALTQMALLECRIPDAPMVGRLEETRKDIMGNTSETILALR